MKQLRIHECLHQGHRVSPALLPVRAEPPKHQLHKAADQIRRMALRQNEQPRVVGDQPEALAPLLIIPTDKLLSPPQMQRGRRPERQTQPFPFVSRHIAHLFSHGQSGVEVVMLD